MISSLPEPKSTFNLRVASGRVARAAAFVMRRRSGELRQWLRWKGLLVLSGESRSHLVGRAPGRAAPRPSGPEEALELLRIPLQLASEQFFGPPGPRPESRPDIIGSREP